MKIIFITNSSVPMGTYFRSHNLAIGLTRMGHGVRIFTCDPNRHSKTREEVRDGVLYRIVSASKGQRWFGATNHPMNALVRAVEDYPQSDIVHLFQPFISGALAWFRLSRRGAGQMWYDWDDLWTDGGLLDSTPQKTFRTKWTYYWTKQLERALPERADRVTTCSQWLADRARERGATNVSVVGNGYWPGPFQDRMEARNRLGFSLESQYIGFMGHSRSGPEVQWCIEGFAAVAPCYPNLRLAFCGIPAEEFDGIEPALRTRIDAIGIVEPKQAALFAAAIDLGLVPMEDNRFSLSRFPVRFAHLLASGTPVLCSKIGELINFFDLPGVLPSGCTRNQWCDAQAAAAAALTKGELPGVDLTLIEQRLSWMQMTRQLAAAYGIACSPLMCGPKSTT